MEKQRMHTLRMVMLAMMVAIGVVISPILRIEGMCPHGASCQYRMLGSDGTVVFPSLCDHDRRDPYDVHGNPATCTDRCSIWRIPFRCVLQTFQRQDHLCGDR